MRDNVLRLIHDQAMVCASNIIEYGPNRKYEWKFWGYLAALRDLGYIDWAKADKIERHYKRYFDELKASRN